MIDPAAPTRARLIRAALSLFQSRGYHAVGISQILDAAGCPKGSLYHHFPGGKVALGHAVIDWLAAEIEESFAKARGVDAARLIDRLFRDTGIWLERHHYRQGALLAVMAQELAPQDPEISETLANAYRRAEAALGQALVAGGLSPARAPDLAALVLATLDGCVARARVEGSVDVFERTARQMAPLFQTA